MRYDELLSKLKTEGNFRSIPGPDRRKDLVDLSGNDYLGLACDRSLRLSFLSEATSRDIPLSSSASRLLAAGQEEYMRLHFILRPDKFSNNRNFYIFRIIPKRKLLYHK